MISNILCKKGGYACMYNLILVDDEPVVLQGIQKVFKLEDFGFTLIRTYTNPLLALEELRRQCRI